jgi:hypothetical protein
MTAWRGRPPDAVADCTTCYLFADHLGSTRAVWDGTGVKARYDYLPFGEPVAADRNGRGAASCAAGVGGVFSVERGCAAKAGDGARVYRQGAGCGDGVGLFWGAVYERGARQVYESGSAAEQRASRQPADLEPLQLCIE